jgi:hypothetical protein
MGRFARNRGYTITALVEELAERAEQRVTARMPSRALKGYYEPPCQIAPWLCGGLRSGIEADPRYTFSIAVPSLTPARCARAIKPSNL